MLSVPGFLYGLEALREKWTLVQNHVHRSHARPAQFLRNASILFGLPGGLNSYTTPAFATGFGYHFDPSDAIILQVEGNKTWELCARRLTNSFSFANLTYNQVPAGDHDVKSCSTVVLQEGDALYLPIGQIHRARTSDHRSIHLTMSLNRQFCSSAAVLLNVAEQINPSKEVGFAQMNFVSWVHDVATEGDLAFLHDVPRAFRCSTRGTSFNLMNNIIGAGFLSLPYCLQEVSLPGFLILMIVIGSANALSFWRLAECCQLTGEQTYMGIAQKAFGARWAKLWQLWAMLYALLTCISYLNIVAASWRDIWPSLPEVSDVPVRHPLLAIVVCLAAGVIIGIIAHRTNAEGPAMQTFAYWLWQRDRFLCLQLLPSLAILFGRNELFKNMH
eukprot:s3158_g8.t1